MRGFLFALTFALTCLASSTESSFTVGQFNIRYDNPEDVQKGAAWKDLLPRISGMMNYSNPSCSTDSRIDHIFVSHRFQTHDFGVLPYFHRVPIEISKRVRNAIEERASQDWTRYGRYEKENAGTMEPKVVFMGNSITDNWYRYHPETVLILDGIDGIAMNKGYVSIEHIYQNIISMAELERFKDIDLVLCPDRDRVVGSINEPNARLRAYAEENVLACADYCAVMTDGNDVMKKEYQEDSVRPNKAGYLVMEEVI